VFIRTLSIASTTSAESTPVLVRGTRLGRPDRANWESALSQVLTSDLARSTNRV